MSVFNDHPHPRVLFEAVPDELFMEMQALVPHAVRVTELDSVHEPEFDLLVTFATDASMRSTHLHVLSFGAESSDSVKMKDVWSTHFWPI
jgi:hypothetical protein